MTCIWEEEDGHRSEHTEQGHCGACRRKWRLTDTDLCPCGKTQTMSHIVESCPLTKLNGSLSRLHSADEDAVSWLTNYGKWHAYEKNTTLWNCNVSVIGKFWSKHTVKTKTKVSTSGYLAANFVLSLAMKEFRKSINISWSYRHE